MPITAFLSCFSGRIAFIDPLLDEKTRTVGVRVNVFSIGFGRRLFGFMSGDTDYMLKIVVKDIADYDRVYKKLISVAPLHDVSSSFAMERIKSSTALPLH